jgi:hypothetical protein
VKRQWRQTLDDLENATLNFNPDGVPVPIDGFEVLVANLSVITPRGDLAAFLKLLNSLIKTNRQFGKKQTSEAFDNWTARDLVFDLRSLSELLFAATKPTTTARRRRKL